MLRHLRVTNFAILSDVSLELSEGFNVFTGETGAGKSLIVEAVNLLRGGRASADIPRAGAKEAVVEAIVELPDDLQATADGLLAEAGLPPADGGELLVRRVIQRGGRSRTYVNGALTTAGRLAELGALLVDLSGQHEHQGLVDPKRHRGILDQFGEAAELVGEMAEAYERWRAADAALAELVGDEREIAERQEYLRFQIEELDDARLEPGEDEQLERERARLQSVDQLMTGVGRAEQLAYGGEEAAYDALASALHELERAEAIDDELAGPRQQLEEARALIEEAAATLRSYGDRLDADPARLDEVEQRLAVIARLSRKHGGALADVIARRDELRAELDRLDNRDERAAELQAERDQARVAATAMATRLTVARRAAARALGKRVATYLGELGMPEAKLSVRIDPRELGPDGADRVELLLASNPGEDAKPLARIASGGELSRIMLAFKRALRAADAVATYVFDEVDAGIGGATAEVVGRQIRAIADRRQVLCVTHLAQIAAFADSHFYVAKAVVDGRTETEVTRLGDAPRRDEISRMLGGLRTSERARAHADEILRAARQRA